jgi:hypothetical protein
MLIFSFDSAVKNMGVSIVKINQLELSDELRFKMCLNRKGKNINNDLEDLISIYKTLSSLLDSIVKIEWTQVINLLDTKTIYNLFDEQKIEQKIDQKIEKLDKKIEPSSKKKNPLGTLLERTRGLKLLLNLLDSKFSIPDIVLVEYQMKQNDCSKNISSQVLYHYDNSHTHLEVVGPSLKNTLAFSEELKYGNFIMKYSNYTANKKHSVGNYNYFIKVFPSNQMSNSKKKDDIADAFIMAYAYARKQGLF